MSFFVFGTSHKHCPIEIREKLCLSPKQVEEALAYAKTLPEISEIVILSTCNRVEFYSFSETKRFPEEAIFSIFEKIHDFRAASMASYFYRHEGEAAIRHLFRVAAGLDSLVVGENEILGQLREAFRTANSLSSVNSLLYRLMEKALKTGKDVRTATKINEGAVSIPSVAVELAEKIFRLSGEKVMVLGTGEMSALTLKNLKSAGADALYVASRNREAGEKLAAEFDAEWIPFEGWPEYLAHVDIVISSTSAPHPVIHFEQVKQVMALRRNRPLFLIDIAVPRDIEPEVNTLSDVYLYNLDDLKGVASENMKLREREVAAAEALVDKAVLHFRSWLGQLEARPTLERFESFLSEVLDKELGRLGTEEIRKKEVRQRILGKLMHPTHEKIKEASENGGVTRYLEALRSLFHLDKEE
ncbi:MAG: glutamyl-tRNA reductase [Candidatus Omnitrophica bacterium]|nr:glutamyl-tRNA reductase [Candidatus Omnitrophota bacterium]